MIISFEYSWIFMIFLHFGSFFIEHFTWFIVNMYFASKTQFKINRRLRIAIKLFFTRKHLRIWVQPTHKNFTKISRIGFAGIPTKIFISWESASITELVSPIRKPCSTKKPQQAITSTGNNSTDEKPQQEETSESSLSLHSQHSCHGYYEIVFLHKY